MYGLYNVAKRIYAQWKNGSKCFPVYFGFLFLVVIVFCFCFCFLQKEDGWK